MIAGMKKITIVFPRSLHESVLQFLQEETAIQLISAEDASVSTESMKSDTAHHIAQLQFALDFIAGVKRETGVKDVKNWKNIFAGKITAELPALEEIALKLNIPSLIENLQRVNDELTSLYARILNVQEDIRAIEPWSSLRLLPSGSPSLHANIVHRLLIITVKDERIIAERLASIPTAIWQVVYRATKKKNVAIHGELIAHAQDASAVESFEQALDATVVTLPVAEEGSVKKKLEALVRESRRLQGERLHVLGEAKPFLAMEQDIQCAYDALLHRLERERVTETMKHSVYSTVLTGWIPTSWVSLFRKRLGERFPAAAIETSDPGKYEKVPILFQNSSAIKPFEAVTDLYGKPAYHELDPTGPLALFFLISFGLALTDAGYGIFIMLSTYLAIRFMRLKRDMQKMMRLLFLGGAATLVMGALTGGWFGITLETLPEGIVKDVLLSMKVIDPLAQPILLLGIIFLFGVVQLMYAWIVRGMYHWNKGEKSVALLDDFSWPVFIVLIGLALASAQGVFLPAFSQFFTYVMYAGLLFMVAMQGRAAKNIFLRIGGGVLSLSGLISFVSDTLSYSRLLALGLATGIIGLVVNLIASMVHESIPVVGIVLAGAVLLVGHVFNLGINALGAFIHSGRLQFVEFFPKFMEGGGVAFRPFGRVGKYVDNPKDFIY